MNASYDFLFLGKGDLTFLMNSLKTFLDQAGLKTEKCSVEMKQLGALADLPEIFVVDAEILNNNTEARVYLFDLCIEKNRKIAIIGEADDLRDLAGLTSSSVVAAVYERPINNKEVSQDLEKKVTALKERNSRKRVLVVDDSPNFLRMIADWLDEDYCVEICPSATAAFHKIEANKPSLILLDYEMPICNGAQFLQMLHSESEFANIPVIFLTSRGDATTVKEVLALKPQGYLLKTQTRENILKFIDDFFKKELVAREMGN